MNDNTIIYPNTGERIAMPTTDKIWDISTAHLTTRDLELMAPASSKHCLCEVPSVSMLGRETAEALYGDDSYGGIMWVTQGAEEECGDMLKTLADEGFSRLLLDIMHMAYYEKVRYVRFDMDADEVEGLEKHVW